MSYNIIITRLSGPPMSLNLCIATKCVFRRGGARGAICGSADRRARK